MNEPPNAASSPSKPETAVQGTPASTASMKTPNIQIKAALLLILMLALVGGSVVYLMYARGVFESTQKLVLVADDSEGVVVGMDLTFSGFPIGRVGRIELNEKGNVHMIVHVPKNEAHWLRSSSIFTLERGLVGNTHLRAYSGILTDPALEDGATRNLLVGDATAEIPRLVAAAKELIQNLKTLTAADSSLDASLSNVKILTDKLNGRSGALGAILGNEKNAQKLILALDQANSLLAKVDSLAAKADAQVFGPGGVMKDTQAAVVQLNALLLDARASLKKVDSVLVEAQAVGANVRLASTDLDTLRADVETSLRKVDHLVNEINRKWPFRRDTELHLP